MDTTPTIADASTGQRLRIAVIGGGVSGNVTARLLSRRHDVRLYESNSYHGGHANSVEVEVFGQRVTVDTGFMVFNTRTYPNFCKLLDQLDVESRESDMSFSVRSDQSGLEYEGSDLNGIFAQRSNLFRPRFLRMLRDILRFNRVGRQAVESNSLDNGTTVGDFLETHRMGDAFVQDYFVPMTAAIWSACPRKMLGAPAKFLIGFCHNHGLLQIRDRPRWRTIVGGSRKYVEALLHPLRDGGLTGCGASRVVRHEDHVTVVDSNGDVDVFDYVVMATHADTTLRLLDDVSPLERELLAAFPYESNDAVLHIDTNLLPRNRRAWASWNYLSPKNAQDTVAVTYDLSRLQGHDTPSPILLTLNRRDEIAPRAIIRTFDYSHPVYTVDSIAAQRRLPEINGRNRTFFCGAYWGYGFHEDGVNSGLEVAKHFGETIDQCTPASTSDKLLTGASSR